MSDTIRSQVKILLALKTIEEKIVRLSHEAQQLPEEIKTVEKRIEEQCQKLTAVKSESEAIEKNLRRAEMDLREREDKLKKAQEKMMEVKTNQQYQAAIKENEVQKQEKSVYEECAIKLMADLEEKKRLAHSAGAEFSEAEKTTRQDIIKLEAERQRVLKLMEDQISLRQSLVSQLSSSVASLYQRTIDGNRSVPVVFAESGRCSGCHMVIRPQLFNEILGCKTIHRCASCGCILIMPELSGENT